MRRQVFYAAVVVVVVGFGVPGVLVYAQKPSGHPNTDNHMTNLKGYGLQQYMNGQFRGTPPARPSSPTAHAPPQRTTIQVSPLPYYHAVPKGVAVQPQATAGPDPVSVPPDAAALRGAIPALPAEAQPVAFVVAHLPPGADLWIEDKQMFSDVKLPEVMMVTPPLERGKWYTYTARVRWLEEGKWVGQMHMFDLRAGDIHHMEVTPSAAPSVEKEVAASLAGLPPADRKAAEAQKVCAVQDTIRLGSMGAPVKITLDGKDVFLCCKGCEAAARKDPAKTAEKVKGLKEKQPDPAK